MSDKERSAVASLTLEERATKLGDALGYASDTKGWDTIFVTLCQVSAEAEARALAARSPDAQPEPISVPPIDAHAQPVAGAEKYLGLALGTIDNFKWVVAAARAVVAEADVSGWDPRVMTLIDALRQSITGFPATPAEHRWSGWPGAWCLDCGQSDANEACVVEHDDGLLCVEGHMCCTEGHAPKGCAVHRNGPCPKPLLRLADPYKTSGSAEGPSPDRKAGVDQPQHAAVTSTTPARGPEEAGSSPEARTPGPKSITREEFRRDPGAVVDYAREHGAVTVVDRNGRPRAQIVVPKPVAPAVVEPPVCDVCGTEQGEYAGTEVEVCRNCLDAEKYYVDVLQTAIDRALNAGNLSPLVLVKTGSPTWLGVKNEAHLPQDCSPDAQLAPGCGVPPGQTHRMCADCFGAGLTEALKLARSQIIDIDPATCGDEYRRGQYRGALDAATVIGRLLRRDEFRKLAAEIGELPSVLAVPAGTTSPSSASVWAVFREYPYEGRDLERVFATEALAEEHAAALRQRTSASAIVEEWGVRTAPVDPEAPR